MRARERKTELICDDSHSNVSIGRGCGRWWHAPLSETRERGGRRRHSDSLTREMLGMRGMRDARASAIP